MTKRLSVLCVLVTVAALAAGCGSKSSSTSAARSGSAASSTSAASSGSGGTNSAAAQAAKQGCEQGFKSNPAIAASKQSTLSVDCQKVADAAASGDLSKYKAAYGTFCNDLASALPAAAQASAKSACEQGAKAIP